MRGLRRKDSHTHGFLMSVLERYGEKVCRVLCMNGVLRRVLVLSVQ
jgi:hypothetical protein